MSERVDIHEVEFAGFWVRFFALLLDGLILFGIFIPISIIGMIPLLFTESESVMAGGYLILQLVLNLIGVMYYIFLTSSKKQGTFGKRALGLIVIDEQGERISNGKSFLRYLASMLSGLILYIGYIMVAFHPQKRSLHDIIAGTYVVKKPYGHK